MLKINIMVSPDGSISNYVANSFEVKLGALPDESLMKEALDKVKHNILWHCMRSWGYGTLYGQILKHCGEGSVGAEIGVYFGDNAVRLWNYCKPLKLYLVDPWSPSHGDDEWTNESIADEQLEERYRLVRQRLPNANICRMTSDTWFSAQEDASFDWVYLDGDHHEEQVKRDVQSAFDCVRVGGLITGDDLANPQWHDPISKAIGSIDPERYEVIWDKSDPWILKKLK